MAKAGVKGPQQIGALSPTHKPYEGSANVLFLLGAKGAQHATLPILRTFGDSGMDPVASALVCTMYIASTEMPSEIVYPEMASAEICSIHRHKTPPASRMSRRSPFLCRCGVQPSPFPWQTLPGTGDLNTLISMSEEVGNEARDIYSRNHK